MSVPGEFRPTAEQYIAAARRLSGGNVDIPHNAEVYVNNLDGTAQVQAWIIVEDADAWDENTEEHDHAGD